MKTEDELDQKNKEILLKNLLRRSKLSPNDPGFIGWHKVEEHSDHHRYSWESEVIGKPGNLKIFDLDHSLFEGYILSIWDNGKRNLEMIISGNIPFKRYRNPDFIYLRSLDKIIRKIEVEKKLAELELLRKKEIKVHEDAARATLDDVIGL